jgi:hypothetical protein
MNNHWIINYKKDEIKNKNNNEIIKNLNKHGNQNYKILKLKIINKINLEKIN